MDKLELDARVERLERKIAIIPVLATLVVLGGLAIVGFISMGRSRAYVDLPMATPASVMVPAPMPAPHIALSGVEGTVPHLARKLREMSTLEGKGLLTSDERTRLKAQLLAKPVASTDLGADLEDLGQLRDETLISDGEFVAIKTKILEGAK